MNTTDLKRAAFRAELCREATELAEYHRDRGEHTAASYLMEIAIKNARAADELVAAWTRQNA